MSKISIFAATILALAIQVHAANAGLVGMPLNLRAAAVDAGVVSPSWRPNTSRAAADPIIEC